MLLNTHIYTTNVKNTKLLLSRKVMVIRRYKIRRSQRMVISCKILWTQMFGPTGAL